MNAYGPLGVYPSLPPRGVDPLPIFVHTFPRRTGAHPSRDIPQTLQVRRDLLVQHPPLLRLLAQRRSQAPHLLFEWLAVVFGGFRADVAAGRGHRTVVA